jgi:hypothetical protein
VAGPERRAAELAAQGFELRADQRRDEPGRDRPAVGERAAMMDPLPHLRARDLGGRRVLHEVVDRHAAVAAEPGREVADRDRDVVTQSRWRDRAFRDAEQVVRSDRNVLAQPRQGVRPRHQAVEHLGRERHERRMGHPGAVIAVAGLTLLVGTHAPERLLVRHRIVLDWNLGRHATHGERTTSMAGADQQQRIGAQEMRRHCHLLPIRQHETRVRAELLDEAEDVVPAAAVEPKDVVFELVENFVHLERGEDGLDQHRALDRAMAEPERLLGEREHLVPQARLAMILELGQVEIRAGTAARELGVVVVEIQPEVDERAGDRCTVE